MACSSAWQDSGVSPICFNKTVGESVDQVGVGFGLRLLTICEWGNEACDRRVASEGFTRRGIHEDREPVLVSVASKAFDQGDKGAASCHVNLLSRNIIPLSRNEVNRLEQEKLNWPQVSKEEMWLLREKALLTDEWAAKWSDPRNKGASTGLWDPMLRGWLARYRAINPDTTAVAQEPD